MNDFSFHVPTHIIFGRDSISKTGPEIKRLGGQRVLIVQDGGAYLKETLAAVYSSLSGSGLSVLEMEEKATRPALSLVLKGVDFCRENKVDFILAVGGGTVMDTAKGIAFMAENPLPLTDWVLYRKFSDKCMPCGCVVTLSGTGSEVSGTAMIMDDTGETVIKYPLFQESLKFRFAVMDPTLTFTLPLRTSLAGAFDAVTHVMEHYFNGPSGYDLQDRLCESIMKSILINMKAVCSAPRSYEVRAQLQMAATLANSTLPGLGCDSDWAVHYMENPITTATHELHGATLAAITVAWMKYCHLRDLPKAVNFALRVMEVPAGGSDEETAMAGILALEQFLEEVGLPIRLGEIGIREEDLEKMAGRALVTSGKDTVGGVSRLTEEEVVEIYKIAL